MPEGYDPSLFWNYLQKRYSMSKVIEISKSLEAIPREQIRTVAPMAISQILKEDFRTVLVGFCMAIYFKHFNTDAKPGVNGLRVMSLDDFLHEPHQQIESSSCDFITLNLSKYNMPNVIGVRGASNNDGLLLNTYVVFEDGRITQISSVNLDNSDSISAMRLAELRRIGARELILVISNTSTEAVMEYEFLKTAY